MPSATVSAQRPKLVVIAGTTASGKSSLALEVAEASGGEIISTDSMQVYRGMDLGTAKPTPEEQQRVRHHQIDLVDPDGYYSAGQYVRDTERVLVDVVSRRRVPLLVGGTGLYYRSLVYGLSEIPEIPETVRQAVLALQETQGTPACWEALRELDSEGATALHPNDTTRVLRALEVVRAHGRPIADFRKQRPFGSPLFPVWIGGIKYPRETLMTRINERTHAMLASGWIEEVEGLLKRCPPDLKPFQSIGYLEIIQHLRGELDHEAMTLRIQQRTRQYAKRQMTWFRKEPGFRWFAPENLSAAQQSIRKFLES